MLLNRWGPYCTSRARVIIRYRKISALDTLDDIIRCDVTMAHHLTRTGTPLSCFSVWRSFAFPSLPKRYIYEVFKRRSSTSVNSSFVRYHCCPLPSSFPTKPYQPTFDDERSLSSNFSKQRIKSQRQFSIPSYKQVGPSIPDIFSC